MKRPFQTLDEIRHVIEIEASSELPEIARPDLERRTPARRAGRIESAPQGVVHDLSKRLAGSARLLPQLGRHVRIECECRTHIMMLALVAS